MKKKIIIALICILVPIGALGCAGYAYMSDYVKTRFAPNTWVDGVYCTGYTPEVVNEALLMGLTPPTVTITDAAGEQYSFDLADADMSYDYSQSLTAYHKHQQEEGWVSQIWQTNNITTGKPYFQYDQAKVEEWWNSLPIVKAEAAEPVFEMKLEDGTYALTNTLAGHLDVEKGLTEVENAITHGETEISLVDTECYFDYKLTAEQKKTEADYELLKDLEQCGLIYDMGAEKIIFDEKLMNSFIAKDRKGNPLKDESGNFYYDLEKADAYMEDLCEQYHTYGVERTFKTSRESGDIVMVKPGNFGTEIDVEAEKEFLRDILSNSRKRKLTTNHVPTYIHETLYHGLDDTGGTYVEVDKLEQKIYFYMNGELMVTSGVVTGNVRTRHDTYEGAFCIQGKYKNRVLRGPGYASFVRRWMPIYKAIGLHDANWRKEKEFGGDTYKRNGSHGCVNMPDNTTDIIFDNIEIGTAVFIFQ
ncbi:MAG: L,D-transpeptidase/peptidoglycan binding protein [Acetatifactor sp.]|nr:L,D-transpeptidase/peptidoglycan binding protein [Acetatifactor sp.]